MDADILIIDDDTELCELLAEFLSLEGFRVQARHNGEQALAHCHEQPYDAIVLDIMLPGLQGLEVLRRLRAFSHTPVLMLTARGEDTDRIVGLELGADDYLPKPCNPRELAARLRAILRRTQAQEEASPSRELQVGRLHLNSSQRQASYNGAALNLTSAEFNVLHSLLARAGQVVDKDTLCQEALGRPLSAYDRSVDVHVSKIRRKLADCGGDNLILSVRGAGYQYAPDAGGAPA
ncbi:response regulator transcription factor [Parahaliea mediterranea]|uniref:response regulator transcription factor n=1 Tax=Parahaliea mediterranea TaxID=651086 RepID=UPI000E2F6E26|nr:response regulator transcription factor [Parahaliea mediterranea]